MVNAIVELPAMNTLVALDRAGRVVLPKTLRDELRWEAGDTLQLESEGERVTLRPIRSQSPLRKERGVWVFYGTGNTGDSERYTRFGRDFVTRGAYSGWFRPRVWRKTSITFPVFRPQFSRGADRQNCDWSRGLSRLRRSAFYPAAASARRAG